MSILTKLSDDRSRWLESLSAKSVVRDLDTVKSCLQDRSVLVRWAAANALGKAAVGLDALLARMRVERNELVLTEICESLGRINSPVAIGILADLAVAHRSHLVRRYALLAIADIQGKASIPFLRDRLASEGSQYVKSTLRCVLLVLGERAMLDQVLGDLRASRAAIRRIVANTLAYYKPRANRSQLIAGLNEALAAETSRGARGDLQAAIDTLSVSSRKRGLDE
jgi:HEAT repeat protein